MKFKSTTCKFFFALMILNYLIINLTYSQGLNNLWLLGYDSPSGLPWGGIEMDFNNGSPQISYVNRPMEFLGRGNSNISDSNGNILFYTNGFYIANALGDTMLNGSGINPSIYTSNHAEGLIPPQVNFILPDPLNYNLYHLFHCTVDDPPWSYVALHLYHSLIDMNLDGGLGGVVTKNFSYIDDVLNTGRITACKHGNGRDWWIFCHKANTNIYYKLLLTPYGIQGPFTQNIGVIRSGGDAGQAVFSPDGSKYVVYSLPEDLEIFDFDRCTGLLSNQTYIAINDTAVGPVGAAISPNSQFLYASSTRYVYQFDLSSTTIASTQTTVAVWDSFYSPSPPFGTYFDIAQLAPDGKIYISTGNSTFYLHVINQPDSSGLGCDLVQHGVLLPAYYYNSLPNHPNYFLGSLQGSLCDTLTELNTHETLETTLKVSPNPSAGKISIQYQVSSEVGLIEVFDILGNKVFSQTVPPWSQYLHLDLGNLTNGIYLCHLTKKNRYIYTKLLINK